MTATLTPRASEGRPAAALSREETRRYGRHLILPEVGVEGQQRLKQARVLLVGAGGLGSPAALYLAAAGVGTLGLVDFDLVELTNLQRQVLHGTGDVGRSKLESARRRLTDLNPHVRLESHETRFTAANGLELVRGYDLVVDGTANFAARYLVTDACVLFGVLPALVGTIQATEAIKLLLGAGEPLIGRLLLVDALGMQFRTVRVRKDPACPACGTREITGLREEAAACAAPAPAGDGAAEILPRELAARLARGGDLLLLVGPGAH